MRTRPRFSGVADAGEHREPVVDAFEVGVPRKPAGNANNRASWQLEGIAGGGRRRARSSEPCRLVSPGAEPDRSHGRIHGICATMVTGWLTGEFRSAITAMRSVIRPGEEDPTLEGDSRQCGKADHQGC